MPFVVRYIENAGEREILFHAVWCVSAPGEQMSGEHRM